MNTSGGLTDGENARLDGFLAQYDIDLFRKALIDPAFNRERHERSGCKWWRAGEGMIVPGTWVEGPAMVLSRHEE